MASTRVAANVLRAAWVGVLVFGLSGRVFAVEPEDEAGNTPAEASACLSGPKGTAPKGERWYYRVERGTKRHCWYTRGETHRRVAERPSAAVAAPQVSAKAADPAPLLETSVANARAEADLSAITQPDRPAPAAEPETRSWQLADRWSDHGNGGAPLEPQRTPPPQTLAPPETPPSKADSASLESVLDVATGALGFAGIAALLAVMLVRRQRTAKALGLRMFSSDENNKRGPEPNASAIKRDIPTAWVKPGMGHGQSVRPLLDHSKLRIGQRSFQSRLQND